MRVLTPLLTFIITLAFSPLAGAQDTIDGFICAFNGNKKGAYDAKLENASPEALKAVAAIADATGLTNDFVVKGAIFPNGSPWAYAQLVGKNRNIVYDVDRFHAKNGKLTWEDLAVLSHEIGHHIHTHTAILDKDKHPRELAADRFAGFAVSRMGGTLEHGVYMTRSFSDAGSKSHPPRAQRIAAITQGWELGERMKLTETGCKTEWISDELFHEDKICRYAVRCTTQGRAVKQACENDNGDWVWSP